MSDIFNVYCDEPKQRAHSSQLCCGVSKQIEINAIPYGRRFPVACCGELQSCHLENDHQKVMMLGAVWCPFDKTREITSRIREITIRQGLKS